MSGQKIPLSPWWYPLSVVVCFAITWGLLMFMWANATPSNSSVLQAYRKALSEYEVAATIHAREYGRLVSLRNANASREMLDEVSIQVQAAIRRRNDARKRLEKIEQSL
jgi:ArsR family metal-binding transcriptional regulator